MQWQCNICEHIWKTTSSSITCQNSGCPNCNIGKNEKIVKYYFYLNGIVFQKLKIDLNGRKIYPDFFLSKFDMIIEYNGAQHYKPVKYGNISQEKADNKLLKQQIRDQNLRKYCKDNDINLLEIDGRIYQGKKLHIFMQTFISNLMAGK
jgi:hypothetical protein